MLFSCFCCSHLAHRNPFFRLYPQTKSSFKVKFIQPINHCKIILEAAKLAYTIKTKVSITCQKFGSCNFWEIANSVLNKGNLLYFLCLKVVSATFLLVFFKSNSEGTCEPRKKNLFHFKSSFCSRTTKILDF